MLCVLQNAVHGSDGSIIVNTDPLLAVTESQPARWRASSTTQTQVELQPRARPAGSRALSLTDAIELRQVYNLAVREHCDAQTTLLAKVKC